MKEVSQSERNQRKIGIVKREHTCGRRSAVQMESKRASPSSVKSSQDANLILATVFPPLEAHSDSVWPARLCSEGKIVSKSEPV